tara:strand:- start:446 stop:3817 length:3372 start_codon:yes stop_codon:yes gene_type:complete
MSDLIQIKRSQSVNAFANIVFGELAFTTNGDVLVVGDSTNGVSIPIAGRRTPGTLSANQAIVVNSTSWVDNLKSVDLSISNTATVNNLVVSTSFDPGNDAIQDTKFQGFKKTLTVSGGKYVTDGTSQQVLTLTPGVKYYFDQSDNTNDTHILKFSETSDGTHGGGSAYTTGVTSVGTPGTAGAYTTVKLEADAPTRLFYFCSAHSGMGGTVRVHEPQVIASNSTVMTITGTLHANDLSISNNLTVNGDLILRGSSIQLGDGGDVISLGATVNTSIIPSDNVTYDLGSSAKQYRQVYANQMTVSTNPASDYQVSTKKYVDDEIAGISVVGNTMNIGTPTDGTSANGKGTGAEGAITIAATDKIADAVDSLNEVMYNVYTNNYVRDVTVTCTSGNTGGAPLTATLTLAVTGNATHYDINWGDGEWSNNTIDSTPSHTYSNNALSPFDVTVTAKNTSALGSGNSASHSVTDLITLYTADPNAAFDIMSASSGGTSITEANINQIIYVDNNTTNANDVVSTFFINWGDGSSNSISNTSVSGGTQGAREPHTYTSGTGTGSNTITLSINTHATANPSVLPDSATKTIKIFDTGIAAPDGLSTKTFTVTGSTGSSPRVASGFINNSTLSTYSVGDTPIRKTGAAAVESSGTSLTQLAYNGASGTIKAYVNGAEDGSITLDSSNNVGGNQSVEVTADEDYYNANSIGESISAAVRTYAPGLYAGFKSKVTKSANPTGATTYMLSHSSSGNTSVDKFILDNLTGTPVMNFSGTSVTQNSAGTLAYVSGIPYYTNDASINVVGALVSNVAGQCYRNTTTPFSVTSGTNVEGDSGSAFASQNKDYTILPSGTLNSSKPIANTGIGANVAIDTFQVLVNGGGRRTEGFAMNMNNVNGTGSTVQFANVLIQTQNGNSSGVNETAIAVSDSLGAVYDTDGKRLSNFSSTNATPNFANNVDYYVNNAWSGGVTVAGTDEAIVRYGTLKHYTTDLSSGYLPAGPDLNTGRSGTQYFRMAFKRSTMSSFDVRLTGNCSSFHIAAPGTDIDDTSDSNGWLNCSATYGGSGTPGANTTAGGNGSDGCAFTSGDRITTSTNHSNASFTMTLGDQSASSSTNNQIIISIGLASGQSITKLEIE